jgi:hypothetical protein
MVRGSGWLEARADLHMKKIYLNLNKISQAVSPNMKEIFKHKNPPRGRNEARKCPYIRH